MSLLLRLIGDRHNMSSIDADAFTENEMIILEIKDNGIGIKDDRLLSASLVGIRGMHEGVRPLYGILRISDAPQQQGTTITATIPFTHGNRMTRGHFISIPKPFYDELGVYRPLALGSWRNSRAKPDKSNWIYPTDALDEEGKIAA